jgi:hypothetical protein
MPFWSFNMTVYVPYRALKRPFPLRYLHKWTLSCFAESTMLDHCVPAPTFAGVQQARPTVSQHFAHLLQNDVSIWVLCNYVFMFRLQRVKLMQPILFVCSYLSVCHFHILFLYQYIPHYTTVLAVGWTSVPVYVHLGRKQRQVALHTKITQEKTVTIKHKWWFHKIHHRTTDKSTFSHIWQNIPTIQTIVTSTSYLSSMND